MTTRTHQTLRIGLRRIIRDPRASVRSRLQAIQLLMQIEGLPVSPIPAAPNKPTAPNLQRLRELAQKIASEEQ
jgi:hypothetical protein